MLDLAGTSKKSPLAFAVNDPAFGQIVGRQLHSDLVTRDNSNEVFSHPASDMREHIVAGFKLDTKAGVGQGLGNGPLDFERFFFLAQNGRLFIVY